MEQGSVRVVRGSETPTERSDRTTSNDILGPDNGSPDLAVVSYSLRTGVPDGGPPPHGRQPGAHHSWSGPIPMGPGLAGGGRAWTR